MARHPDTEGNDLQPNRIDAKEDVTVPDGSGGRLSVANIQSDFQEQVDKVKSDSVAFSEGFAPGLLG